ncbi:MAG TPA: ABC transporter permease [Solirubrobacterales bacterium]
MARFAARRLVSMAMVLFAVSLLVFLIFNVIPGGDPAARMAGKVPTEREIEAIRAEWDFDEPVYAQYATTMEKLFSGDLVSYVNQLNVTEEILKGAPRTFALAIGASIIWMLFAIALGVYGAVRAGAISDRLLSALALIGIATPVFWLGAMLGHYLGTELGLFPASGYVEFLDSPAEWLWHLILPWFTLAVLFIGIYSRVLRADITETMGEEYVRAARAKGLSERQVMLRHVLRNSLIPIVTLWGLDFGAVLGGGAILTEQVFNLQGVGQYAADSIGQFDVPAVMGVVMYGAFFIVIFNTLVDIAYAALDPRIRLEGGGRE